MVNDGSTDDTAEVIRQFRDRICYVEKANGGKASAVNLGLKYVTDDDVWILDDDDIALPNKLALHAAHLSVKLALEGFFRGIKSKMWGQLNCRDSDTTISKSGNTSATAPNS